MEDELDMETQLEREFAAEQEELLEVHDEEEEEEEMMHSDAARKKALEALEEKLEKIEQQQDVEPEGSDEFSSARPGLSKVRSLPSNFIYNPPVEMERVNDGTFHGDHRLLLFILLSNSFTFFFF